EGWYRSPLIASCAGRNNDTGLGGQRRALRGGGVVQKLTQGRRILKARRPPGRGVGPAEACPWTARAVHWVTSAPDVARPHQHSAADGSIPPSRNAAEPPAPWCAA